MTDYEIINELGNEGPLFKLVKYKYKLSEKLYQNAINICEDCGKLLSLECRICTKCKSEVFVFRDLPGVEKLQQLIGQKPVSYANNYWTDLETRTLIANIERGYSTAKIAKLHGRTISSIRTQVSKTKTAIDGEK